MDQNRLAPPSMNSMRMLADLSPSDMLLLNALQMPPSSIPSMVSAGYNSGNFNASTKGYSSDGQSVLVGNMAVPIEIYRYLTATPTLSGMYQNPQVATIAPGINLQAGPISANVARQMTPSGGATTFGGGVNLGPLTATYARSQPDKGAANNTYGLSGAITPDVSVSGAVTTGGSRGNRYQAELNMQNLLRGLFSAGVELTPAQKDFAFYGRYTKEF